MKPVHTPIRVAALGMEQRAYRTLQFFFQGQCKNSFVLVEEHSADICIIDMDSHRSDTVLEKHRKLYPGRPAIVISIADQADKNTDDALFVRKPLQIATLTQALNEAQASILHMKAANNSQQFYVKKVPEDKPDALASSDRRQQTFKQPEKVTFYTHPTKSVSHQALTRVSEPAMASLPDADESGIMYLTKPDMEFNPYNSSFMSMIQYQPRDLLQNYVQQAFNETLKHQCNVRLEGPWRPITIYYRSSEMGVRKNIKHLYALSSMRIDSKEVTITVLDEYDTPQELKAQGGMMDDELVMPIEQFLWKLALRTSRGRVPVGTNFYSPVKLVRWPNLARNAITPHSFRIAALWAKQPTSLLHTADILGIPLQYVFVFYSAALAANLVEQHATIDCNVTPKRNIPEHAQRNIFKVLINRLRSI